MVAKSYQSLQMVGEPFTQNGRQYIKVITKSGTEKTVRWYTDDEYYQMYPEETPKTKKTKSLKEVLGFEKGYITLFKGEYDDDSEFLHSPSVQYNRLFGWFCPSHCKYPDNIPDDVTLILLNWDDIAVDDDTLLAEQTVRRLVEGSLFQPSESQHQGAIGDKISARVVVKKVMPIDGMYGRTYFHVFHDDLGNVYTWNTKTQNLSQGRVINLTGTVSAHDTYRNENQTKLVRCKVDE
jgi:hypothetical protein